uniref:Uncharacterized protein n=1 Tax=Anguilla anguilla TaxID=7936 RepID=A0A0E9SVP6_ANGAN
MSYLRYICFWQLQFFSACLFNHIELSRVGNSSNSICLQKRKKLLVSKVIIKRTFKHTRDLAGLKENHNWVLIFI